MFTDSKLFEVWDSGFRACVTRVRDFALARHDMAGGLLGFRAEGEHARDRGLFWAHTPSRLLAVAGLLLTL